MFKHFRPRAGGKESREQVQVFRIPEYIGEWDSNTIAKEYDRMGNLLNDWDYAYLDILKGLSGGKDIFTIDEYIEYVEKLSRAEYFSDTDFTAYSSVNISISSQDRHNRGFIRFIRSKGNPQMVMDVPLGIYDCVCREFGIG